MRLRDIVHIVITLLLFGGAFGVSGGQVQAATATITVRSNPSTFGKVKIGSSAANTVVAQQFNTGATAKITAVPNTYYRFVRWNDNNTSNPRTITVTGNATYTAYFELQKYTITFKNWDGTVLETKTVNPEITPTYTGTTPTRPATAQYTYSFSGWSPALYAADKDQVYTANFTNTLRRYGLTVASANYSQGTVTGGGTYYYGTNVTITATARGCYRFKQWNDGNKTNPRTVTVTDAKAYIAQFEQTTYNGNCGANGSNVAWSLNICTGVLTLSGSGAMADYNSVSLVPWYNYRSSITSISIGNGITKIGYFAFSGCSNLTSVSIPNSVTTINTASFKGCSSLTSVVIPNSVTTINQEAFRDCTSLSSLTLGTGLQSIGFLAFYNCTSLTTLSIPRNLTPDNINDKAFYNCTGITDIYVYWETQSEISMRPTDLPHGTNVTLHVPCGTKQTYSTRNNWWDYTIGNDSKYTITLRSNNGNWGKVRIDDGTAGATARKKDECDTWVVIKAEPEEHYHFVQWNDGNTSTSRGMYIGSSNVTYTATFAPDQHRIGIQTNRSGYSYKYYDCYYGSTFAFTAPADDECYYFVNWEDGVTDRDRTYLVTENKTFRAIYEPAMHTITVNSANSEQGLVAIQNSGDAASVSDQFQCSNNMWGLGPTISATAADCYRFKQWNDGNTDNPRMITIEDGDYTFTAEFEAITYPITVQSANPAMGTVEVVE